MESSIQPSLGVPASSRSIEGHGDLTRISAACGDIAAEFLSSEPQRAYAFQLCMVVKAVATAADHSTALRQADRALHGLLATAVPHLPPMWVSLGLLLPRGANGSVSNNIGSNSDFTEPQLQLYCTPPGTPPAAMPLADTLLAWPALRAEEHAAAPLEPMTLPHQQARGQKQQQLQRQVVVEWPESQLPPSAERADLSAFAASGVRSVPGPVVAVSCPLPSGTCGMVAYAFPSHMTPSSSGCSRGGTAAVGNHKCDDKAIKVCAAAGAMVGRPSAPSVSQSDLQELSAHVSSALEVMACAMEERLVAWAGVQQQGAPGRNAKRNVCGRAVTMDVTGLFTLSVASTEDESAWSSASGNALTPETTANVASAPYTGGLTGPASISTLLTPALQPPKASPALAEEPARSGVAVAAAPGVRGSADDSGFVAAAALTASTGQEKPLSSPTLRQTLGCQKSADGTTAAARVAAEGAGMACADVQGISKACHAPFGGAAVGQDSAGKNAETRSSPAGISASKMPPPSACFVGPVLLPRTPPPELMRPSPHPHATSVPGPSSGGMGHGSCGNKEPPGATAAAADAPTSLFARVCGAGAVAGLGLPSTSGDNGGAPGQSGACGFLAQMGGVPRVRSKDWADQEGISCGSSSTSVQHMSQATDEGHSLAAPGHPASTAGRQRLVKVLSLDKAAMQLPRAVTGPHNAMVPSMPYASFESAALAAVAGGAMGRTQGTNAPRMAPPMPPADAPATAGVVVQQPPGTYVPRRLNRMYLPPGAARAGGGTALPSPMALTAAASTVSTALLQPMAQGADGLSMRPTLGHLAQAPSAATVALQRVADPTSGASGSSGIAAASPLHLSCPAAHPADQPRGLPSPSLFSCLSDPFLGPSSLALAGPSLLGSRGAAPAPALTATHGPASPRNQPSHPVLADYVIPEDVALECSVAETVAMMRALARARGAHLSSRMRRMRVTAKIQSAHPEGLPPDLPARLAKAANGLSGLGSGQDGATAPRDGSGGGAAGAGPMWILTGVAARKGCVELVFDMALVGGSAQPGVVLVPSASNQVLAGLTEAEEERGGHGHRLDAGEQPVSAQLLFHASRSPAPSTHAAALGPRSADAGTRSNGAGNRWDGAHGMRQLLRSDPFPMATAGRGAGGQPRYRRFQAGRSRSEQDISGRPPAPPLCPARVCSSTGGLAAACQEVIGDRGAATAAAHVEELPEQEWLRQGRGLQPEWAAQVVQRTGLLSPSADPWVSVQLGHAADGAALCAWEPSRSSCSGIQSSSGARGSDDGGAWRSMPLHSAAAGLPAPVLWLPIPVMLAPTLPSGSHVSSLSLVIRVLQLVPKASAQAAELTVRSAHAYLPTRAVSECELGQETDGWRLMSTVLEVCGPLSLAHGGLLLVECRRSGDHEHVVSAPAASAAVAVVGSPVPLLLLPQRAGTVMTELGKLRDAMAGMMCPESMRSPFPLAATAVAVSPAVHGDGSTGEAAAEVEMAAHQFLTDLGLLVDVAALCKQRAAAECPGTGAGVGEGAGGAAAAAWSLEKGMRALLQLHGGPMQPGQPGVGVAQGGCALAPCYAQHLVDVSCTLLAACCSTGLLETAALVLRVACGELALTTHEVLLEGSCADPRVAAQLLGASAGHEAHSGWLGSQGSTGHPAACAPRPSLLAAQGGAASPGDWWPPSAGLPLVPVAESLSTSVSTLQQDDRPPVLFVPPAPPATWVEAIGACNTPSGAALGAVHVLAKAPGLLDSASSPALDGGSAGRTIDSNATWSDDTGATAAATDEEPLLSCAQLHAGTGRRGNVDRVAARGTELRAVGPVPIQQPSDRDVAAGGAHVRPGDPMEALDVAMFPGAAAPPLETRPADRQSSVRFNPTHALPASRATHGDDVDWSVSGLGSESVPLQSEEQGGCDGQGLHAPAFTRHQGLLQGPQAQRWWHGLSGWVGNTSSAAAAKEAAYWRFVAERTCGGIWSYFALVSLIAVISCGRAAAEDGVVGCAALLLFAGGQAAVMGWYCMAHGGRQPGPMVAAALGCKAVRMAADLLMALGLLKVPSLMEPMAVRGIEVVMEAVMRPVAERVPLWQGVLAVLLEAPCVWMLYRRMHDMFPDYWLRNHCLLRTLVYDVIQLAVMLAAEWYWRGEFRRWLRQAQAGGPGGAEAAGGGGRRGKSEDKCE